MSKKLYRPYLTESDILWILSQQNIPGELKNKLLKFQFSISHGIIKESHIVVRQTMDEKLGLTTEPIDSIQVKRKIAYDAFISGSPISTDQYEQAYHYMIANNLFLSKEDKEEMESKVFQNSLSTLKGI